MDPITVLPQNSEQKRVLEAFLQALKMDYFATRTTLEDLENQLLPGQRAVWESLKRALLQVEKGTAQGRTWADFKKLTLFDKSDIGNISDKFLEDLTKKLDI